MRRPSLPTSLLLLSLLFAACSSTPDTPSEYHQSARPMPAPFNPMTDSPHTVGQPGHVRPGVAVEPNPKHSRVLPQDENTRRQPGVWASDAPDPDATPRLFGVPPLDPANTDPEYVAAMRSCAAMMERHTRLASVGDLVRRLAPRDVACLAGRLYAACAEESARIAREYRHGVDAEARTKRLLAVAKAREAILCRGTDYGETDSIVHPTTAKYQETVEALIKKGQRR